MRISTAQLFQQRVTAMQDQQTSLAHTELQLSTGKRLVSPADDPVASLRNLQLIDYKAQNQQHIENIDTAQGRLDLEEGALASGVDLLQRLRELALSAQNATLGPDDLQSIGIEARSLLDGLVEIANTQNVNGEYLFAGYQVSTRPFTDTGSGSVVYNGDQGRQHLQISATRQLAVADNGADVFLGVGRAAGGVGSVFDIASDFANALAAGAPTSDTVTDIDAAMNRLLAVRADVGSRMNAVTEQRDVNQSYGLVLDRERSDLTDLDYTEAVSRYNRELVAFQASQQVFAKVQDMNLFNFIN